MLMRQFGRFVEMLWVAHVQPDYKEHSGNTEYKIDNCPSITLFHKVECCKYQRYACKDSDYERQILEYGKYDFENVD